jgi:hypothetical protein
LSFGFDAPCRYCRRCATKSIRPVDAIGSPIVADHNVCAGKRSSSSTGEGEEPRNIDPAAALTFDLLVDFETNAGIFGFASVSDSARINLAVRLATYRRNSGTYAIMRIFLRSTDKEPRVEEAVNLLRSADILVGSGAIVRQEGELTYGAITLYRDCRIERALLVLARAGIKASA